VVEYARNFVGGFQSLFIFPEQKRYYKMEKRADKKSRWAAVN